MTVQEALEALKIEQIQIEGKSVRVAKFFEGISAANEALEKQIPKKVVKDTNYSHGRYTVAKCPTCDGLLGLYSFAERSFKCCIECGQALDWGDSE